MLFATKIPNPNDPGSSGSGFTLTTHIDESELLYAGEGVNAWGEISSLMPVDNGLFFKWGGEIGTPIELTYSFIGSDFIDYDESYYDVTGSGSRDAELEASSSLCGRMLAPLLKILPLKNKSSAISSMIA